MRVSETEVDIRELPKVLSECCAAAASPPLRVGDEIHLDVQGTPAGMVYRVDGTEGMLYVYFDLGYHDKRNVHRKLLELNASITPPANGYYAIDPILASVIYRVNVPLSDNSDGALLHRALCTLAQSAKRVLES